MRCLAALLFVLLLLVPIRSALAMQFARGPVAGGAAGEMIYASGPVKLGDDEKLRAAVQASAPGSQIVGLSLNSPGGDAAEGVRLAKTVHALGLATAVGQGAMCASACFNVFAAGRQRFASSSALIGVHGASLGGLDDPNAEAVTVQLARQLAGFGVPEAILGKMIVAKPDQMWWLTRADLDSIQANPDVPTATGAATALGLEAPVSTAPHPATVATDPHLDASVRIVPVTRGYHVAPPASGGFQVWSPGPAH